MRTYARSLYTYIRIRENIANPKNRPIGPKMPKMAQKSQNFPMLIFRQLQRKCIFYVIFLQKYLVNSKICCTFALAFEKQVCFDFLPEARTLKFRFTYVDLIFLRQTERDEAN